MLRLEDEVIIKDLKINDGIGFCDNLSRDLIVVNSPRDVLIRNTSLATVKRNYLPGKYRYLSVILTIYMTTINLRLLAIMTQIWKNKGNWKQNY